MKPQQQTLSVRISDAMRRRLESARHLVGKTIGESVSISDVANRFLETAQDDNIEASDLLSRPTETLLGIRRKWEHGQSLSRPEWQVIGYYLQVGCEETTEEPELPTGDSYVGLLEAFVAALAVRAGGNRFELDHYYLGNLRLSDMPYYRDDMVTMAVVIETARGVIDKLKEAHPKGLHRLTPIFVGRNLYVVFRDERLKGIEALNEVLRPYRPVLFRIAARGHYLREKRPVRDQHVERDFTQLRPPGPPPVVVGDSKLSITLADNNEFTMLLDLEPQRVLYPLERYPVIHEFEAMLRTLKPGEQWMGREFFGYTGKGATAFNFRRRSNGIVVAFSAEEWFALGELLAKALALPELHAILKDSELAYGEI
jgi:hypothetical protein